MGTLLQHAVLVSMPIPGLRHQGCSLLFSHQAVKASATRAGTALGHGPSSEMQVCLCEQHDSMPPVPTSYGHQASFLPCCQWLLHLAATAGMVGVTVRPKDDPLDSTELSQRGPGSLRSSSEGARRLASFQRLLSRARGKADSDSDSDPHQQLAEGVPLRADEPDSLGGQVQVQMQHIGHDVLHHHHQQQQQRQEEVVLLGQLSPAVPSDWAHSMHHRHTPTSPPGSPGQGEAAAQLLHAQQHQQLFVPVPSGKL